MARKRMVDPGIWASEQVNNLSRDARLMFIGLFSNADDAGRLKGSPRYLKAIIFPYDNLGAGDIERWLDEILSQKLAIKYNVDGDDYIWVPNFLRHQTINRPSESKLPEPNFNESSVKTHGVITEPSRLKEVKLIEVKRNTTPSKEGAHKGRPTNNKKDATVKEIFSEMRLVLKVCGGEAVPAIEESSAGDARSKRDSGAIDPIPNYGREGKAIKRMLTRGFTREAILECWKDKVSQRGGEFVSMTWVNEDIGKSRKPIQGARRLSTDEEIAASIKEATTWHGKK